MSNYAGCHDSRKTPIDMDNNRGLTGAASHVDCACCQTELQPCTTMGGTDGRERRDGNFGQNFLATGNKSAGQCIPNSVKVRDGPAAFVKESGFTLLRKGG